MPDHFGSAPRERMKRFYRAVEEGNLANVRKFLSPDLINVMRRSKDDSIKIPIHIASEKEASSSSLKKAYLMRRWEG